MLKSRKKKRNRYQESRIRLIKGKIRKFLAFFSILAVFSLVVILGAGLTRLYYALLDASWLKVEDIEIAGLKKLDRNEILDTIGVSKGECILNLRMGPVAERLRMLPPVKTASVRLELPSRIVAEITEREPIAIVKGDDFYMVDAEGLLFTRAVPEENRGLPVITGIADPGIEVGSSVPARKFEHIKELVAALDKSKSWLPSNSVIECRWSSAGFELVLGERGVPVEIGRENLEQKLARLRQIIDTLKERQWTEVVTRIDLDYPGRAYLDGQFPIPKPVSGQHARQSG
jgi:cell division septal protein FtsQ